MSCILGKCDVIAASGANIVKLALVIVALRFMIDRLRDSLLANYSATNYMV